MFGGSFAVLLAVLLARNPGVFTVPIAERGDAAANSILVEQAKHLHLLVGNYSRVGFFHPGPAFFYLDALGEWLGYDVLHALPTPYNGQWLAAMAVNAALVAAALTVLWTWSRSWRALLACGAVTLAFVGTHNEMLTSTWMPFVYVAPFLLFLTAAASVAAGRTRDTWLLTLAGGLLVHGHAEFLVLFVPALALGVVAVLWYRRRRRGPAGPPVPAHWLAASGVAALFALPMVVNLALHFPGEYPKYVGYGGGHTSSHGPGADLRYLLWFWFPQRMVAAVLLPVLFAAAVALVRVQPAGEQRRFLACGVAAVGGATVLFAAYIVVGIDILMSYVGYFFWAVPLLLLLLLVVAVDALLPPASAPAAAATVALALVAALVFVGVSPAVAHRPDGIPAVPGVTRAMASYAQGRPAVLVLDHDAWPSMTALLVAGERTGQRVCVADRSWEFMVTKQFVCTARERAGGVEVRLAAHPESRSVAVSFGGTTIAMPDPFS